MSTTVLGPNDGAVNGVKIYYFDRLGEEHSLILRRAEWGAENWLHVARELAVVADAIFMSAWELGPIRDGELPAKWDWLS